MRNLLAGGQDFDALVAAVAGRSWCTWIPDVPL